AQLIALGKALADSERAPLGSELYEPPTILAAIRMLILTGCRRGEICNLQWSEVDLERGVLDLEASKTGRKTVQLNAPARQLLASLPRASEYVFPSAAEHGRALGGALWHTWARVRARAGIPATRIHDLRHSFAATGAGLGASLPILGALLGHTAAATTQRYAGIAEDPRREA